MFSLCKAVRLFHSDETAATSNGRQSKVESSSLRIRDNSHDLNCFGIYERHKFKYKPFSADNARATTGPPLLYRQCPTETQIPAAYTKNGAITKELECKQIRFWAIGDHDW